VCEGGSLAAAGAGLAARSLASAAMAMHLSGDRYSWPDRRWKAGSSAWPGRARRACGQQPEDFQLGFQLIRNAVDHQIGLADDVFDGGDEGNAGQGSEAGLLAQQLLRVMQVGGITSSSSTRKPARAALRASQRPSGPAPIMATVSGKRSGLYGQRLDWPAGAGLGPRA